LARRIHNNLAGGIHNATSIERRIGGFASNARYDNRSCANSGIISVTELKDVIKGWSVQRQLLGQSVYNEKDEKIGKIEDIILNKDRSASYGIVSTGGFLGLGSHDVAIPAKQLQMKDDRLVLPGATKEQLRAMPTFEYAPR